MWLATCKGPQCLPLWINTPFKINCALIIAYLNITFLQSYVVPDAEKQSHKEAFI